MGWTWYFASHYDRRGRVNRKAECNEIMESGGRIEVVRSTMVGSVYYAALKTVKRFGDDEKLHAIPEENQTVFAVVVLTSVRGREFGYKDMDETEGPTESKCPISILQLLSPTDSEFAKAWRQRCELHAKNSDSIFSLGNLPIGSVINTGKYILIKYPPCYQFKTPFWMVENENHYVPKTRISDDFTIEYYGNGRVEKNWRDIVKERGKMSVPQVQSKTNL